MSLTASNPQLRTEDLLRLVESGTLELVDGKLVEKNSSVESCEVEGLVTISKPLRREPV